MGGQLNRDIRVKRINWNQYNEEIYCIQRDREGNYLKSQRRTKTKFKITKWTKPWEKIILLHYTKLHLHKWCNINMTFEKKLKQTITRFF